MFGKKEIVYIDRLAEYRKIEIKDGFHLFDEVIVTDVYFINDQEMIGKKFILIEGYEVLYSEESLYRWGLIDNEGKNIFLTGNIKKSYGEFQEEFEAIEEAEKLALEVQERLQKLEQLKKKTDKIKDLNLKNLGL